MADSRPLKIIKMTQSEEEYCDKGITDCLPREILEDITAKVASHSVTDLYHLKLASKEIMNITNNDHVYKHASLDKVTFFACLEFFPQQASFLSRCRSSGNLETLYREGIIAYFRDSELYEKGFDMIHMTAHKGHQRSMYAFAMIVLLMWNNTKICVIGSEELLEEAFGYLRFLRNQKCALRCRNEVTEVIRMLRWKMRPEVVQLPLKCLCKNVPCKNTWRLKTGSWYFESEDDDENDPGMCENCRWNHELEVFCAIILGTDVLGLLCL